MKLQKKERLLKNDFKLMLLNYCYCFEIKKCFYCISIY